MLSFAFPDWQIMAGMLAMVGLAFLIGRQSRRAVIEEQENELCEIRQTLKARDTETAEAEREVQRMTSELQNAAAIATARAISERELVSAFTQGVSLRNHARGYEPGTGVHDLSQTVESVLGDILAHDRYRLLLIEWKKLWDVFRTELRKKARPPQMAALRADTAMTIVSRACHFGGWGIDGPEVALEFATYLDAWDAAETDVPLAARISTDQFFEGFLPEEESHAKYGVRASVFLKYVQFLQESAPEGLPAVAGVPLLIVARYQKSIRFLRFSNVESLALAITQSQRQRQAISHTIEIHPPHRPKPRRGPKP